MQCVFAGTSSSVTTFFFIFFFLEKSIARKKNNKLSVWLDRSSTCWVCSAKTHLRFSHTFCYKQTNRTLAWRQWAVNHLETSLYCWNILDACASLTVWEDMSVNMSVVPAAWFFSMSHHNRSNGCAVYYCPPIKLSLPEITEFGQDGNLDLVKERFCPS